MNKNKSIFYVHIVIESKPSWLVHAVIEYKMGSLNAFEEDW